VGERWALIEIRRSARIDEEKKKSRTYGLCLSSFSLWRHDGCDPKRTNGGCVSRKRSPQYHPHRESNRPHVNQKRRMDNGQKLIFDRLKEQKIEDNSDGE
jgi:hypothetical protein